MIDLTGRAFVFFVKSVIFWFVLFLFMEFGLLSFGAMITHSHCPNHSRNNTENMHTHDTTDAGHNEKHKTGHPHTWEFDEFCPKGTERDTKKKSKKDIQEFPDPPDPVEAPVFAPQRRSAPVVSAPVVIEPVEEDDEDDGIYVVTGYPSAPRGEVPVPKVVLRPVFVTEYMIRDGGMARLPVWIEVYNPNAEAVSLQGYTFTVAERTHSGWVFHAQTFREFSVPAVSAVLLVSHLANAYQVGGVDADRVYDLGIPQHARDLKSGWKLEDSDGEGVHVVGIPFGFADPVLPGIWHMRKSFEVVKSGSPPEHAFYGMFDDIGTPGFFEAVPSAPSRVNPRLVTTWASLKASR